MINTTRSAGQSNIKYRPRSAAEFELRYSYAYPCPKKFYKLPDVLFCYTSLFYKLSRAWAWVCMSQLRIGGRRLPRKENLFRRRQ